MAASAALARTRTALGAIRCAAAASQRLLDLGQQHSAYFARRRASGHAPRPSAEESEESTLPQRSRGAARGVRDGSTRRSLSSGVTNRGPVSSLISREAGRVGPQHLTVVSGRRNFTSTPPARDQPDKLRVAIVGGGAAGLSAALHLAPLADAGIIASPIDVFETTPDPDDKANGYVHPDSDPSNVKDERAHYGSGAAGRDIGVGLWSTALLPLASTGRESHESLLRALERVGRYVGAVGYRTPNGAWLSQSELNTSRCSSSCSTDGNESEGRDAADVAQDFAEIPGLLFLREKDLLKALRKAAAREAEEHGTIKVHYGAAAAGPSSSTTGGGSTTVAGIHLPSDRSECGAAAASSYGLSGLLEFADGSRTPADSPYHLVVAAGGMHSALRLRYAGRSCKQMRRAVKSASSLAASGSTSGLTGLGDGGMADAYRGSGACPGGISAEQLSEWALQDTAESHAVEDRGYTVFRGNAEMSEEDAGMAGQSFQTWGECKSMRFAAVNMSYPSFMGDNKRNACGRAERQVWFATTNDLDIAAVKDPEERKARLKEAFGAWHNPVNQLIDATPADGILMERGVAHKYSIRPVLNLADVVDYERKLQKSRGSGNDAAAQTAAAGPGPALMFTGDASMTVDPVLAQGFTFAMESAAELAYTVRRCCDDERSNQGAGGGSISLGFNPDRLRSELLARHYRRYDRLMCLLRSTEMVQALAQPEGGTVTGFLSRNVIRAAMRLTPEFVKRKVFTTMMRYSLGLTLKQTDEGSGARLAGDGKER